MYNTLKVNTGNLQWTDKEVETKYLASISMGARNWHCFGVSLIQYSAHLLIHEQKQATTSMQIYLVAPSHVSVGGVQQHIHECWEYSNVLYKWVGGSQQCVYGLGNSSNIYMGWAAHQRILHTWKFTSLSYGPSQTINAP